MVLRILLLVLLLPVGAAHAHGGKGHCGHHSAGGGHSAHNGSHSGHSRGGHPDRDHIRRVRERDPIRDEYFYPYRVLINNSFHFQNADALPAYTRHGDYIVYNGDTLDGVVTLKNDRIVLQPMTVAGSEVADTFLLTDIRLTSLVATGYRGQRDLFLTRMNEHDKKMLRVLHSGKLSVYDDSYIFPDAGNVDVNRMKIASGNSRAPHCPAVVLDPELYLIRKVNKAYGLDLKKKDFTIPGLLAYLDRLD